MGADAKEGRRKSLEERQRSEEKPGKVSGALRSQRRGEVKADLAGGGMEGVTEEAWREAERREYQRGIPGKRRRDAENNSGNGNDKKKSVEKNRPGG